eukprot:jgi/Tetstr1/432405/TSEL_021801.t1
MGIGPPLLVLEKRGWPSAASRFHLRRRDLTVSAAFTCAGLKKAARTRHRSRPDRTCAGAGKAHASPSSRRWCFRILAGKGGGSSQESINSDASHGGMPTARLI